MPLVDFEWEFESEDFDGHGPCLVAQARDSKTGKWYQIAIELRELEEVAQLQQQRLLGNEQVRKH